MVGVTVVTTRALAAIGTQFDALVAIGMQRDIDSTNETVDPYY